MENKITSLHSTFSINGEVSNEDTRFMNITIDVLHLGLNRNASVFTKDVVDASIESIKNTPVLGFIEYNEDFESIDFKGHENILVKTENGVEEKYIGSAYGVIPESCNPRWVTKMCSDGQEREFLQVDALLWSKFSDASDIMMRDIEKSQSMELEISSIEGVEDSDGIFYFESFRFDGCCILGESTLPAMVDANVAMKEVKFALDSVFAETLKDELNDKFTTFTKLIEDKSNQGGVGNMGNTNFKYVTQHVNDIVNIVSAYESVDTWYGTAPRFSVIDIQDDEVIVVDQADGYSYYGFKYTVNDDKPEIDFACKKKKRAKCSYSDYVDGSDDCGVVFDFGKHIANIENVAFGKFEEANGKLGEFQEKVLDFESKIAESAEKIATLEKTMAEKTTEFETKISEVEAAKSCVEKEYEELKSQYADIKSKYDEFVEADEKRKADEISAAKDAMFAEFEDALGDNADFIALKEKKDEFTVDEIEGRCAILYVKNVAGKSNFSHAGSSTVLGVMGYDNNTEGFVSTKYGNIPVNR